MKLIPFERPVHTTLPSSEQAGYSLLRWGELKIRYEALEDVPFQGFLGPTLRGFIGEALHSMSSSSHPGCDGGTPYTVLFERPRPVDNRPMPAPAFVLQPPSGTVGRLRRGQSLRFGLRVFGDGLPFVPDLIHALDRFGVGHGITRESRRVLLQEVTAFTPDGAVRLFNARDGLHCRDWQSHWTWQGAELLEQRLQHLPDNPHTLQLWFQTPVSLKENGRLLEVIRFPSLVRSVIRNVRAHVRDHCGGALMLDISALLAQAEEIHKIADCTDGFETTRRTRRQARRVPIAGRIGALNFHGDLKPFVPLMLMGDVTQIGRSRAMGFGCFRMRWHA